MSLLIYENVQQTNNVCCIMLKKKKQIKIFFISSNEKFFSNRTTGLEVTVELRVYILFTTTEDWEHFHFVKVFVTPRRMLCRSYNTHTFWIHLEVSVHLVVYVRGAVIQLLVRPCVHHVGPSVRLTITLSTCPKFTWRQKLRYRP